MAGLIQKKLAKLPVGTMVLLTYEAGAAQNEKLEGTVSDNDFESSLEVRTSSGSEILLDYALVLGIQIVSSEKTEKTAEPLPIPTVGKAASDLLNVSDAVIQQWFQQMPLEDRRKMLTCNESFRNAIKLSSMPKMAAAAGRAKALLYEEYDREYDWSDQAIFYVGALLRRTSQCDCEVYLLIERFREAAYAAFRTQDYALAEAYAVLALMKQGTALREELYRILGESIYRSGDASGLRQLWEKHPPKDDGILAELLTQVSGMKAGEDPEPALILAEQRFPERKAAEEIRYWLDDAPVTEPSETLEQKQEAPLPVEEALLHGCVSRLLWSCASGEIRCDEDEKIYPFSYEDVEDPELKKAVTECCRSDLNGTVYNVCFHTAGGKAVAVRPDDQLLQRARAIAADLTMENRFETAFGLDLRALETKQAKGAMKDLIQTAIVLQKQDSSAEYARKAVEMMELHPELAPETPFEAMAAARCMALAKCYGQMKLFANQALHQGDVNVRQLVGLVNDYCAMVAQAYSETGDKDLLRCELEDLRRLRKVFFQSMTEDPGLTRDYWEKAQYHQVLAECQLEELDTLADDFEALSEASQQKLLPVYLKATSAEEKSAEPMQPELPRLMPEPVVPRRDAGDDAEADEEETEVCLDPDSWHALGMSTREFMENAMKLEGKGKIPAMMAYLHAGASRNEQLRPICRAMALAVNDPMEPVSRSIDGIADETVYFDPAYPVFNACCLASALLRAYFFSEKGHDYSAKSLMGSLNMDKCLPALLKVCELLAQFREKSGQGIDCYAPYRIQDIRQKEEERSRIQKEAKMLFEKYIQNPARESVRFARLLATKKIVFDRSGVLARTLEQILLGNTVWEDAESFYSTYFKVLNREQIRINDSAVEALIDESWALAAKGLTCQQATSTLQGNRHNNLRCSILEILRVAARWRILEEESRSTCNEAGRSCFETVRAQVLEQLDLLEQQCREFETVTGSAEMKTGLELLRFTAGELTARLNGSWKAGMDRYFYAEFLRTGEVLLNPDFLPDLSAVLCGWKGFTIFDRIRAHLSHSDRTLQEQLDRIYGSDPHCSNYGAADQILANQEALFPEAALTVPENATQYRACTGMQAEMRWTEFRRTLAMDFHSGRLSLSGGFRRILQTVQSWYFRCRESGNYGFFTKLVEAAEKKIRQEAADYGRDLLHQLELLRRNTSDVYSGLDERIRSLIEAQEYTAAEYLMAIDAGKAPELNRCAVESRDILESFLNDYPMIYRQTYDLSASLYELRPNPLTENWMLPEQTVDSERIRMLLDALGLDPREVTACQALEMPEEALFDVSLGCRSGESEKRLLAACIRSFSDCESLMKKIACLDRYGRDVLVLMDHALGVADRRALGHMLRSSSGLRHECTVLDRVMITWLGEYAGSASMESVRNTVMKSFSNAKLNLVAWEDASEPLEREEAAGMLTGALAELGFRIEDDKILLQILASSGCDAKLLKMMAEKLTQSPELGEESCDALSNMPPYPVGREQLGRILADPGVTEQIRSRIRELLAQDETGRSTALVLLLGWMQSDLPDAVGFSAPEILSQARELSLVPLEVLSEEQLSAQLRLLQRCGMVRCIDGSFRLGSRYFRELLGTDEELLDQLTACTE